MKKPNLNQVSITLSVAAIIIALLALFPVTVQAGGYGGLSYDRIDYDESGLDLAFSTYTFIAGSEFNDYVSAEFRYGNGNSDDSAYGADIEIDRYMGLYTMFTLPLFDEVEPYGVVGYTRGKMSVSGPYGSASETEGDPSYGFGVKYNVSERLKIRGEWMRLMDGSDYHIDSLSAAIIYHL